jgi:hypothetical protein
VSRRAKPYYHDSQLLHRRTAAGGAVEGRPSGGAVDTEELFARTGARIAARPRSAAAAADHLSPATAWRSANAWVGLKHTGVGLTYTWEGLTHTWVGLTYTWVGLTHLG